MNIIMDKEFTLWLLFHVQELNKLIVHLGGRQFQHQ